MTFPLNTDRSYEYTLVGTSPGDAFLYVSIDSSSQPDPNTANNTAQTIVHMVPLSLKLKSAGAAKAPRAGKRFVWALELVSLNSGKDIQPNRVSCLAHIGKKSLRGKAAVAQGNQAGQLQCTWLVPPKTTGRKLAAHVQASVALASTSLNHTFSIH